MSFIAIFNSDCAAVDLGRLKRTKPEIATQNIQILGRRRQVAFIRSQSGPTLPREETTCCAALDGRFWFIGRVRLDARDELYSIVSKPQAAFQDQSDALICLGAYARWSDRCLEHLRGDFCFALWDEDRQRLFCGRDQLGVRPLFYTTQGNGWFVSDSLDFTVAKATVNGELDDYWVADFLSSGFCTDKDRTVYKQVKRLPPAHFLSICARESVVHKYWKLEIQSPIYYPRTRNYVERFREVIASAIKDRLPQDRVGIAMSGGLDSSTLAVHTLNAIGDASKIVADTGYFEYLIPDEEKYFSSLVARRLGISQTLRAVDDLCYDPHWYEQQQRTPEPNSAIVQAAPGRIIAAEMAKEAQVWFFGEGPDNALVFEWQPYLWWLFKKADGFHFCGAIVQYILGKQVREWRTTISNYVKRQTAGHRERSLSLPPWLNKEFVNELQLIPRACELAVSANNKHPWHPRAIGSFTGPLWQHFLEQFDPSVSGTQLVWRHPYLDLRVLTFLLSVPPIPWARRKRLIREAMRGHLPEEILFRDKTPLQANPLAKILQKHGLPQRSLDGPIRRYIDQTKLPKDLHDDQVTRSLLRVYVLDSWLKTNAQRLARL
jgi:asparagine synthase (glutamine-hydrolysing)